MGKTLVRIFLVLVLLGAAGIAVYFIPPVHERLAWRVDDLRSKIKYAISPPEKAVFVPQQSVAQIVNATLSAYTPSPLPAAPTMAAPAATARPDLTPTSAPTAIPTLAPTAIPAKVELKGVVHEYQKWNNCGPATLAMALTFWGWKGNQMDTAAYLKPNPRDKNVMPYEMADYVAEKTDLKTVIRVGGDVGILKRLIAAGFPVVVEKGFEVEKEGWMGHYEVLTGYDDARKRFIAQDSYIMKNLPVPYAELESYWRAFNDIYLVIFPAQREAEVLSALGPQADETANYQFAAQKASDDIARLSGRDQYFAWYNRGSNLVALGDYGGAAAAYDEAFALYPTIPEKKRPWRMLWYQTGPYFAYHYTGRYYDVINLATTTLNALSEQTIEETFVWRARARAALGDTDGAVADLRASLKQHVGFAPAVADLAQLGLEP